MIGSSSLSLSLFSLSLSVTRAAVQQSLGLLALGGGIETNTLRVRLGAGSVGSANRLCGGDRVFVGCEGFGGGCM